MSFEVGVRNPLHPVNLDLDVAPVRQGVGHLVYRLLVDLHAVDGEAWPRVQFLVTNVTFEMLRLLMLDQYLFVVELPVAVPKKTAMFCILIS